MNKHGVGSLTRLKNACKYSLEGFITCYKTEEAFRQELWLCIVLAPVPFFLTISPVSRALMFLCLFLVLIVELLNSGIEALADEVTTERRDLIKKAKDVSSTAVSFSLITTTVVWGTLIFSA